MGALQRQRGADVVRTSSEQTMRIAAAPALQNVERSRVHDTAPRCEDTSVQLHNGADPCDEIPFHTTIPLSVSRPRRFSAGQVDYAPPVRRRRTAGGRRASGVVYLPTHKAPQRALVRRQIEVGTRTVDRIVGDRYDWRDGDWTVRRGTGDAMVDRPTNQSGNGKGHGRRTRSLRVRDARGESLDNDERDAHDSTRE